MKLFRILLFLLLASISTIPTFATTVVGTIVDPNGNPYRSGTLSAYPGHGPVSYNTPTDMTGSFTLDMPADSYAFTVCGTPVNIGPLGNVAPRQVCFTASPVTITGTNQDVSAALNASATILGPVTSTSSGGGGVVPVIRPPILVISPTNAPLSFGSVTTGTDSPAQAVTISNPCVSSTVQICSPTFISSVISSNPDYRSSAPGNCNGTIGEGLSCTLLWFLHPTIFTPEPASTLTVNSNAQFDAQFGTTNIISLTGSGTSQPTFPLTINFSSTMTGSGTVTTLDGNINCHGGAGIPTTGQCTIGYITGSIPQITATPDALQTFGGLSGGGCSTSPCSPTITVATTVTATFTAPIPTAIITLSLTGQGAGGVVGDQNDVISGLPLNCNLANGVQTGKCTGVFNIGSTINFTETPAGGGSFITWSTGCGTNSGCPVPVGMNTTIGASFAPPPAGAPISLIQSITPGSTSGTMAVVQAQVNNSPSTGTTCAVTVNATGTGNLLLYVGWPGLGNTLTGVAGGGTFVVDSNANHLSVAHALVSTPGATTITGTFSGSTTAPDFGCRAYEISDAAGFALDTITAAATIATCNTCTAATPTVTGANDLILEIASQNSAGGAILGINGGYSYNGDVPTGTGGARLGTGLLLNTTNVTPPAWNINPAAAPVVYAITFKEIQTSVFGTFGAAQTAANTNIVYVGWNDATTTVSSITDTSGNTYTASTCNPAPANGLTLKMYWAGNIAAAGAGVNKLKIALSASPSVRLIQAAEYSGLTATPVDTCAGATGAAGNPNSGATPATGFANDLLTGASMLAAGHSITAVSTGWTQRITASGNDFEDQQGVPIAAYTYNPTQNSSGAWAAVAGAWKNAGGGAATTVSFNLNCAGGGSGTATVAGQTLTCTNGVPSPTSGISLTVAVGSVQTINNSPASGSAFITYVGGGCGTQPQCNTQPITINTGVTVRFDLSGGTTYFVNPGTGSDANDGLFASQQGAGHGPWLTIPGQAGKHSDSILNLGATGTVVNVAAGNYQGPIITNNGGTSASKRITYVSTTPGGAKILTSNWQIGSSWVDINNFDLTSPASGNNFGIGVGNGPGQSIGVRLLNNYAHDFDLGGCAQFGIFNIGTANTTTLNGQAIDTTVKNNIIRRISAYNGTGPNTHSCITAHGIYDFGVRTIIQNNQLSASAGPAIERVSVNGTAGLVQGVISGNTIFNNGGGININESIDSNPIVPYNRNSITNNIIVNNGTDDTVSGGACGIDFYHVTGLNNLSSNNLIYGNKPHDLCHHDQAACGTDASGATPVVGNNITGSDGNGNNGGCPAANPQTDAGGVTATFTGFVTDSPTNPITPSSNYVSSNYKPKITSNAHDHGTTTCASGGITPCAPTDAIDGTNRPVGAAIDIGPWEQ